MVHELHPKCHEIIVGREFGHRLYCPLVDCAQVGRNVVGELHDPNNIIPRLADCFWGRSDVAAAREATGRRHPCALRPCPRHLFGPYPTLEESPRWALQTCPPGLFSPTVLVFLEGAPFERRVRPRRDVLPTLPGAASGLIVVTRHPSS